MSYTSVLVYVDADEPPENRVRVAAAIADKFNSALIGISAFRMPAPVVANGMVIDAPNDTDFELINAKLAQNGEWFKSIAGADHRRLKWRSALDRPTETLVRESRSGDLVVIGSSATARNSYGSVDSGAAILNMGRPALVVPEGIASLNANHVVVGWKDTREARRAVRDALPFLHMASRTTLVEACRQGEEDMVLTRLNDVAMYLKRHRVECGSKVMVHQEGSGASQLINVAQGEGADLLVTGAYGHSRLGEWIFGGMTQELLANSAICCLMSH